MTNSDGVLPPRTRRITVIAQDPSVRRGEADRNRPSRDSVGGSPGGTLGTPRAGRRLRRVARSLPEAEAAGGRGRPVRGQRSGPARSPIPSSTPGTCYAIVMSTLARFEFALGRRVDWSFGGHQIKVVPHAFADANAFYSRQDEAIMFGYFQGTKDTVFTCLSHDVISHETTHALLDGLRERYMDPSSARSGRLPRRLCRYRCAALGLRHARRGRADRRSRRGREPGRHPNRRAASGSAR